MVGNAAELVKVLLLLDVEGVCSEYFGAVVDGDAVLFCMVDARVKRDELSGASVVVVECVKTAKMELSEKIVVFRGIGLVVVMLR